MLNLCRDEEIEDAKTWTEANDFELLYAKEFRQYLEKSRIIGLFHCNELKHYPELFVSDSKHFT